MGKSWYIDCPVCGQQVEVFDICKKCGWHNSGRKEGDNDPPGPNKMTLDEAKTAYRKGEKVI